MGAANTNVGLGSTSYEVTNFKLEDNGYNFKVGDVFKPVGLVTDRFLNTSELISDFELTVLEVFRDQYSSWNLGQFDYIDPIKDLQDGVRTRFPLNYNSNLLSFEVDAENPDSSLIDLNSLLLVFVNGVIQDPGESYNFDGGTSFIFTQPPDPDDIIDIFFYKGTEGVDAVQVAAGSSITPTIQVGDTVQLGNNNLLFDETQADRIVYAIRSSDELETNIYTQQGINEDVFKPLNWTKQKVDKKVNGELVFKSRDSIESQVYPTAKIIGDLTTTSQELFVDNAKFFNYEEDFSSLNISAVDGLIVNSTDIVGSAFTAIVSVAGTISSLSIINAGKGYVGSGFTISISPPINTGTGIGITAIATATVTNGVVTGTTITNPGAGYTSTSVPPVLAPTPKVIKETIVTIPTIKGFDGSITGIAVTGGVSVDTALQFTFSEDLSNNPGAVISDLAVGYPILVFDTQVGHGVTSIDGSDSFVVGIGSTFVDNIYKIAAVNTSNKTFTCNIMSGVNTTGIDTSGTSIGSFSWGRLSGFGRGANPISIGVTGLTIDAGLTTFPSIQRRGFGLRSTGSLRKDLG